MSFFGIMEIHRKRNIVTAKEEAARRLKIYQRGPEKQIDISLKFGNQLFPWTNTNKIEMDMSVILIKTVLGHSTEITKELCLLTSYWLGREERRLSGKRLQPEHRNFFAQSYGVEK